MKYPLSATSLARLETCDPRLQDTVRALCEFMNVTVICGHRNKEDQDLAFAQHRSQTPWPQSKHNTEPSLAVDVGPYPIVWPDSKVLRDPDSLAFARYAYMIGLARGIASQKGVDLRSGIDWDSDGEISDNKFMDLPHLELREK